MDIRNKIITGICRLTLIFVFNLGARAQNNSLFAIQTLPIEVSASRTVSLSFPAAVKALDRGSAELLAQKAKGAENVVLLKAARTGTPQTSLIVITADGDLHSFEVFYREEPSAISLQVMPKSHKPQTAQFSGVTGETRIKEGIRLAISKKPNITRRKQAGSFSTTLDGLYVLGPVMYLRLSFENRSVIDYDIETLRLFTAGKKQIKRSASQEEALMVMGMSEEIQQVKASEQTTLVLAIPKMTLPKNRRLSLAVSERNGARQLVITLKSKDLDRVAAL
jgi:conjugative transposon TraN protein